MLKAAVVLLLLLLLLLQAGLLQGRCWVGTARKPKAATLAQLQWQQPRRGHWECHLALSSAASAGGLVMGSVISCSK
jgi:hypothetical protein